MSIEETSEFQPKFDTSGLIVCVTVCADTKDVLMVAYMNREALDKTLETREMHYWSRTRSEIWRKGATSGHTQKLAELRVDCDQDCLLAFVKQTGGRACHTGRTSCFYRVVRHNGNISLVLSENA